MKKVLSAVAALGLVVGVASTASAAFDSFSVDGYYKVEGYYITNFSEPTTLLNPTTNNATALIGAAGGVHVHDAARRDKNGAWWQHSFRMTPKLVVNDKVTMLSEIRLLDDHVWADDLQAPGAHQGVDVDKLYMEYMSPLGKVRIGRIPWGKFGPDFANSGTRNDGIVWFADLLPKPFSTTFVYGKLTEGDIDSYNGANDQDRDYYEGRLGYATDMFNGQIGLAYDDDQDTPGTLVDKWRFRGFGHAKLASINIDAEFDHWFGDTTNTATNFSQDYDQWAYFIGASTQIDKLTVGAIGWVLTGDQEQANDVDTYLHSGAVAGAGTNTNDLEAYGASGNDFEPLLIATGSNVGLLNADSSSAYSAAIQAAGVQAIGAYAAMPVSDKLTVSAVAGSAWASDEPNGWDDHMGWEIDLKADYKILDNLTYSLNFGYFSCGDFFDMRTNTTLDDGLEDKIYYLGHVLNMTF